MRLCNDLGIQGLTTNNETEEVNPCKSQMGKPQHGDLPIKDPDSGS